MPQPDSSRDWAPDRRWNETDAPWPVDPAAPRRIGAQVGSPPGQRPKEKPEQDGRTPDDRDGNEEQAREDEEKPASQRIATERKNRDGYAVRARQALETEDTGQWVASERFTLEDELEDTWPNVPARYFDD